MSESGQLSQSSGPSHVRSRSISSEADLVTLVFEKLASTFGVTCVCSEVPILGRSADIVYTVGDHVVSIECKVTSWRRAIRQARDHKLAADYAFVCMPNRPVTDAMLDEFRKAGVGLAFVDSDAMRGYTVVVDAPQSDETWEPARQSVRTYLGKHCSIAESVSA